MLGHLEFIIVKPGKNGNKTAPESKADHIKQKRE